MTNTLDWIIKARSGLMKGHVGMASMLLHLDLKEVDASECSTMATDGKNIYFCPEFCDSLTLAELQGVLIHEALHVVYEHPLRRGKRHPKVWNIACDYAINNYLKYDLYLQLPMGGVWDRKYHKWTAEQVYRDLINDDDALQDAIDNIEQDNQNHNPEESDNDDSEGEGSGSSEGEESDDESSVTGQGNIPKSLHGKIDLDSIPDSIGEVWDATEENGEPLSEAKMQELSGEIQRAVSLADKVEIAMSESGTSSMRGKIEQLKEVYVDWKEYLNEFLATSYSDENCWSRPNRRHSHRGVYLPSRSQDPQGGEIALAIDTSGSVSQFELNVYATEIQAMAESCGIDTIRVCYCDTTVRKNSEGEWWDVYNLSEGDELSLVARGGGGTDFNPPFNLLNDYSDDLENVQAFIYFTDGWGEVKAEVEPDVPVIWCITENSSYADRIPFGEKVFVNTAEFY